MDDHAVKSDGKIHVSGFKIKITSYGELYNDDDFFDADENIDILEITYIIVDDIEFSETVTNVYPSSAELPLDFETWYPMDVTFIPKQGLFFASSGY